MRFWRWRPAPWPRLLGDHGINIAGMQVGRKEPGGESIMILKVDHVIPEEVLEKLKKLENIKDAKVIHL